MSLIKNHTPYIGKIRLKLERDPYYTNGRSRLNKVHLNLGFLKLVSRIILPNLKAGTGASEYKLNLLFPIEQATGLNLITDMYRSDEDHEIIKTYQGIVFKNKFMNNTLCLHFTPINSPDQYVSVEDAFWMYKKGLHADDTEAGIAWDEKQQMWWGWSHRAAASFGLGDKIFDEKWDGGGHGDAEMDDVPFNKYGNEVITNIYQARQAALNFHKYIS